MTHKLKRAVTTDTPNFIVVLGQRYNSTTGRFGPSYIECHDCGERYYVEDGKPKANGKFLIQCLANHPDQNRPERIAATINAFYL